MNQFKIYDISTTPSDSRVDLEKIKLNHGNILNVYGIMAESPSLLKGYLALKDLYAKVTLTKQERNIVMLTASRENGSAYDTAAHSVSAEKHTVPAEVVEAVRTGKPLKDNKLEALRTFTVAVVNGRGQVGESEIKGFLDVGYTQANILEVVLAVGLATLANYTNLVARTPLDAEFEPKLWKKAS